MKYKIYALLFGLFSFAAVVIGWADKANITDIRDLPWWDVSLLYVVVGWGIAFFSRSPSDAHKLDRDGLVAPPTKKEDGP